MASCKPCLNLAAITLQEHVKTHSEEYKFNCKFCNNAFMNRNVMVSHQKTCHLNSEATMPLSTSTTSPTTLNVVLSPTDVSLQPPPEKRSKLVLNSDEIKNLIMAKDEEIRKQEEANRNRISAELAAKISTVPVPTSVPMVTIPTSILMQEQPDIKHESIDADVNDDDDDMYDDDVDDEEGVDPLENSLKPNLKPVVRKRAPVFPFEVNSPDLSVVDVIKQLLSNAST